MAPLLVQARTEIDFGRDRTPFAPRFANAFSYYGVVLLTTELFQARDSCGCEYLATLNKKSNTDTGKPNAVPLARLVAADAAKIEPSCSLECKYLTSSDYRDLLWTSLAEFPGDMRPLGAFSCSSCVTVAAECASCVSSFFAVLHAASAPRPDQDSPVLGLGLIGYVEKGKKSVSSY